MNSTNSTIGPFHTENDVLYFVFSTITIPIHIGILIVLIATGAFSAVHTIIDHQGSIRRLITTNIPLSTLAVSMLCYLVSSVSKVVDSFLPDSLIKNVLGGISAMLAMYAVTISLGAQTLLVHLMLERRYIGTKFTMPIRLITNLPLFGMYAIYVIIMLLVLVCGSLVFASEIAFRVGLIVISSLYIGIFILTAVLLCCETTILLYSMIGNVIARKEMMSKERLFWILLKYGSLNCTFLLTTVMLTGSNIAFLAQADNMESWATTYLLNRLAAIPVFFSIVFGYSFLHSVPKIPIQEPMQTDLVVYKAE